MIQALIQLFQRDLNRLKKEMALYSNEKIIWKVDANINNSVVNLCLHLIGNLKTYIGVALAKSGYIRQRELEFSNRYVSREELIQQIDETIQLVEEGLNNLNGSGWDMDFPIQIWDHTTPVDFTLIHLYGHINYHYAQINYHRRLLDK